MFSRKKASKENGNGKLPKRQDSSSSDSNERRNSGSSRSYKSWTASLKSSKSSASREDSPRRANSSEAADMVTYSVQIPPNVKPGDEFQVKAGSKVVRVRAPKDCKPGHVLQISVPVDVHDKEKEKAGANVQDAVLHNKVLNKTESQNFQVIVPRGVQPGQPFALLAGGVRVLVTCPSNATPGQKIQFELPKALVNRAEGPKSRLAEIKLSYDKDGWTRTIRATDMKFQWTRFDHQGGVDTRTRFDADRSAYVRKIQFLYDNDRMRSGRVSLVTPDRGVVDSSVKGMNGEELVSYSDIASAQMKGYDDKIQWFQDKCAQLCSKWSDGSIIFNVRRENLLDDSMVSVLSMSLQDLRKIWRFNFIGEAGIDAGGLAKEWFELVTEKCFDPSRALWQPCATNQMCLQINPASEILLPDDHLLYFRFIGRVLGRAMFDRQLVKCHMVKYLYKHILGWPIMFNDLKDVDEVVYNSLKGLKDMGADVEYLGVDFTATEKILGVTKTVELIPNGANVIVTEENLPEYIEAYLKYCMLGRYEEQINELLLGFFDVIPEPLLTIFDFQELELLMCGLPEIDLQDWMENTEYSGEFEIDGPNHEACKWFWEVVSEFDHEMKARLLQFVTATSGVPARGFGTLQGSDATIRKFTIHGVTLETCVYPRSHTCFNRIDLPCYERREELEEKLKIAITMASTGFYIE